MAVRIRLARVGATKRPSYRVVAIDRRRARDGRALEILGFYDPLSDPATVHLDEERIREWMRNGATPSDMVVRLMRQAGFAGIPPAPRTERAETVTVKPSRKRKAAPAAEGTAPTTSADPATPAQAADPATPAEATEAAAPAEATPAEAAAEPEAAATGSAAESPVAEASGEAAADAASAGATGDVEMADAAAEAPDTGDATESTGVEEQASR